MTRTGKKTSITDIAGQLGVSVATVSRVLNNRHGIQARTRKRVLDAAREMGFKPRVSSRPTTIGIVMDLVGEPSQQVGLIDALTVRVAAALAQHQFAVEIFTAGNRESLHRRLVDGVLAIAWEPDTLATLRALQNVPAVIFNRPEVPECSQVLMDDVLAGRMAARHMIEHGHRNLGFMTTGMGIAARQRLEGFRAAIVEAGLELPERRVGMTRFLPPYSTVQQMLRSGVTGIFLSNESLTAEVPYLAAEALQTPIPTLLSVVGVEIASAMRFSRPPMTLIAHPVARMADTAVEMLREMIATGDYTPRTVHLEPELIVRDSVAAPPKATD